jgi:hypothetical protein
MEREPVLSDEELTVINATTPIPLMNFPGGRNRWAKERGIERSLLMKVHGGLGDQICTEPALRFALETFKGVEISLFALDPILFQHLKFKNVFNMARGESPGFGYNVFDLFATDVYFINNFIHHDRCHAVDYSALVAFQGMVPKAYRELKTVPSRECFDKIDPYLEGCHVVVHPGKSWQSKTFPVSWWNAVLARLKSHGVTPLIIGRKFRTTSTIEGLNTEGCIDLRDKLELMETVALLQGTQVVLTNDSSPLHFAATGDAWIGYVTMARRPEFLEHQRNGQQGWRMENMSLGGIWEHRDVYLESGHISDIGDELRDSWLPKPEDFADWAIERL